MAKITGKGSFAGVPFLIEENQTLEGGRRLVKHEYPLRDDGLTEDLGKKVRSYNISCLVIGDDHIAQAEKLIEALEKGRGELKHPFFKNIDVCVDSYKAHYSTGHLRVTRFDITFTPDIKENAPETAKNTQFSALAQYTNAINALSSDFAEQLEGMQSFVDSLLDNPVLQFAGSVMGFVESAFENINAVAANIGEMKSKALALKNHITGLVRSPLMLAKTLQGLVQFKQPPGIKAKQAFNQGSLTATVIHGAITDALKNKTEMPRAKLSSIINAQRHRPTGAVAIRNADLASSEALAQAFMTKLQFNVARLIKTTLAVEQAKAASQALTDTLDHNAQSIESKTDVASLIEEIDKQLEEVILDNADAENWQSYQALEQFRSAIIADLRTRGEQLSSVKNVALKDTYPALVVQYTHSGNSQNWQQFAERNGVYHPLFCIGGTTVEVLQ